MKLLAVLSAALVMAATTSTAQASTKSHAPMWFVKEALCVHSHEAPTWKWAPSYHPGYTYWNGYYTGLQFLLGTWSRANTILNRHDPATTGNRRLVILHAYAIWKSDGGSWREWRNTAALCGYN